VKFYAGQVLANAESPLISAELKNEAQDAWSAATEEYKVTDPGWI